MSALAIATALCSVLTAAVLAAAGWRSIDLGGPVFTLTIAPITLLVTVHLVNALRACLNLSGRDALHELAIVIVAMWVVSLGAAEYAKGPDGIRDTSAAARGFERTDRTLPKA